MNRLFRLLCYFGFHEYIDYLINGYTGNPITQECIYCGKIRWNKDEYISDWGKSQYLNKRIKSEE